MIKMPWTDKTIPHFVLEINRECNISCRGCYKKMDGTSKSLLEIEKELVTALSLRKVQTVSIAGGEPLLHPQILEIVELIHGKKLRAAIVTNGLLADKTILASLKTAGLDVIMFHVDEGQTRPDLPGNNIEDIKKLRTRLISSAKDAGLDAGLCVTVYPEYLDRVPALFEYIIHNPDVNFGLISGYTDVAKMAAGSGCPGKAVLPGPQAPSNNKLIMETIKNQLSIEPFGFLASGDTAGNGPDAPQWMSYFIPVIYSGEKTAIFLPRPTRFDLFLISLPRLVTGKFSYYFRPDSPAAAVQVFFNSLATGRLLEGIKFLLGLRSKKASLRSKRIIVENGARIDASGEAACCSFCPNATVRDGKLTRICLADHTTE